MVLVTGGAGFIGSAASSKLIERGYPVVVYDNLSTGHRDAVDPAARFVEGDTGDPACLEETFRRYPIRVVLHFAAAATVDASVDACWRDNLAAPILLLDAARSAGVERFIFSSSAAVYGQGRSPLVETAPLAPITPYGLSKSVLETMMELRREPSRMACFSLRYFNVCGPGERHSPETHLIPLVLETAAGKRKAVRIFGDDHDTPDGACVRDYVHVADAAEANIAALEADAGLAGSYNVGTGRGHSVKEVIGIAREVTGCEIPVEVVERRAGDPAVLIADTGLIRERLGWRARRSLKTAIRAAWEGRQKP